MAAIGWYGPLIDLSKASSHIGDYVQLLVFIHRSTPIQYKMAKGGGEVIRTDIQVGDDTRRFFSVSIWQKQIGSMVFAGDIVLLQNVKITKFGDFVEARTIQCSSLLCLVHPSESLVSKGVEGIIGECRVGVRTKEKLRKVIEWVQQTGSTLCNVQLHRHQPMRQQSINWKVHEERGSQDFFSLLEVSHLTDSCKATFYASIGEIFLKHLHESEEERMFISRRLWTTGENNLTEDLICSGCQLCGSPLNSELGSTTFDQSTIPLYCPKSTSHLHLITSIYRPFMLYVWDDSKYIPLLVTNKAAELLFGNIKAERVYSCYKERNHDQTPNPNNVQNTDHSDARATTTQLNAAESEVNCLHPPREGKSLGRKGKQKSAAPNLYLIWLVLLKVLMQQGKNSPLKFKVTVNVGRDWESGRFEMVSVSILCFGMMASLV
ncbi:uncharacterized protein LOC114299258 isoform X1 [Camellia sinensis]|uniref:uncharacterized protein LOC114299258 isoform X1 n=1 Tax=Camellia sinensis TaxID=4442 RepID=UPI0010363B21|nr:uncharacterized protein LOC114299258 isoform X1 [Camellia sinensis]